MSPSWISVPVSHRGRPGRQRRCASFPSADRLGCPCCGLGSGTSGGRGARIDAGWGASSPATRLCFYRHAASISVPCSQGKKTYISVLGLRSASVASFTGRGPVARVTGAHGRVVLLRRENATMQAREGHDLTPNNSHCLSTSSFSAVIMAVSSLSFRASTSKTCFS